VGVVFRVSAVVLEQIDEYCAVREDYPRRLSPLIRLKPTTDGGQRESLERRADYYRFFDATPQAEFLYSGMKKAIEQDLPHETDFLRRYDQFLVRLEAILDRTDRTIDLPFQFLRRNGGRLSKRGT